MRLRRVLKTVGLMLLGLLITFAVGLTLVVTLDWVAPGALDWWLSILKPYLFVWRLVVFGGLIVFWPRAVQLLVRWRELTPLQTQRLLDSRWTVALWLVALELGLGQNVVGQFVHTWVQGDAP